MIAFLLLFVTLGRLYRDMIKQPETRALLVLAAVVVAVGVTFYVNVEHWSFINFVQGDRSTRPGTRTASQTDPS